MNEIVQYTEDAYEAIAYERKSIRLRTDGFHQNTDAELLNSQVFIAHTSPDMSSYDDFEHLIRTSRESKTPAIGARSSGHEHYWQAYLVTSAARRRRSTDASVAGQFRHLCAEWKEDTQFSSSGHEIVLHLAYQRIIGLGPPVISHVFNDLRENDGQWFWALRALTGENPVSPESIGQFDRMKEEWLSWAASHGY